MPVATEEEEGYAPYDPTGVEPLIIAPALSSDAPQAGSPRPDTEAAQAPEDDEEAPLPEFDPRWVNEFEGLLFVGSLSETFVWAGHTFRIRTLNTDDLLQVAMLHKEYIGTIGDTKAYQSAMVAASVLTIDGKPLPEPVLGDNEPLKPRFDQVIKWFPSTIDKIYEHYLDLEVTVGEVLEAMGKATG